MDFSEENTGQPQQVFTIAETDAHYSKPGFDALLSIALRMVVEVMIGIYVAYKSRYLEEEVYQRLQVRCEFLRKMVVGLKK